MTVPSVDLYALVANYAASGGAVFPQLELIVSIDFPIHYSLVGVHFATTYTNISTAEPGGIFIIINQTVPRLAISPTIRAVASQIMFGLDFTQADDWISFGDYGIDIPPRTPISLYGFGQTAASPLVRLFSVAALQLVAK